jgi:hypothetical protein
VGALPVEVELVDGQVIGGHPSLAGVTTGARVGYVGRIDARGRVVDLEYLVPAVAVEARSWVGVAFGKLVAMNAPLIPNPLVGGQVILSHLSYVSVATGTQGGAVSPDRDANITGLGRLCRLRGVGRGITAVTVVTAYLTLGVDAPFPLGDGVGVLTLWR